MKKKIEKVDKIKTPTPRKRTPVQFGDEGSGGTSEALDSFRAADILEHYSMIKGA